LSKTNGGVFPTDRVYKSIDGRNGIPSHERFDMPFWGTTFQREGQKFTPTSEAAARAHHEDRGLHKIDPGKIDH
jgi:hypothetical protein